MAKLSPMMEQYFDIKKQYPGCILFFRLGDFYEMFYDDALTVSKELELTLTGKNCGQEERAPMCGVPFHSAEPYIHRLVEKGYKVAICEQIEDPAEAKGIVKRDVIKIVTPGTITSGIMLDEGENNYLACLYYYSGRKQGGNTIHSADALLSLSYSDISTGELAVTEAHGDRNGYGEILDELIKLSPKEIIVNQSYFDTFGDADLQDLPSITTGGITVKPDTEFNSNIAEKIMTGNLGKGSVIASGLKEREGALSSLAALLSYLLETQKQNLRQITSCCFYELGSRMSLDKATLRNLEITETLYDKKRQGSLLGIMDHTHTAMGARLLKKWLREPLNKTSEINPRLDAVQEIVDNPILGNNLAEQLKLIYDFERLAARVASGNANGRDLLAIKRSVNTLPDIKNALEYTSSNLLTEINEQIIDLSFLGEIIEKAINPDAPITIKEGDLILPGYSEDLDQLKDSIKDAKNWIAGLEGRERERTGIKNLKVGFNKVFGYYIDVTRSQSDLVPEDYIRKQTLVNNERYITPELKEMENLVFNAETKINKLEYELFLEIRNTVEEKIEELQETSHAIATLDCLCSFAICAVKNGYVRPQVDDSLVLEIIGGRHPVVEQTEGKGLFVSNDTYLDGDDNVLAIITGPNMSGKSTYMRQTALIVLMAQAGSFVPAESARIGVCDRIFTRIGASDNLAQGQSTFYVEMSELSYILNSAKERSLIILDEIGRGTSTYDGLSIAWAAASYLCNDKTKIRTLFATHYHELTELSSRVEGIFDLNVDVAEENGEIVFLHKIVPGAASKSYGIHVARLAGIPDVLLEDAERKLSSLEEKSGGRYESLDLNNQENDISSNESAEAFIHVKASDVDNDAQISLFTTINESELINRIKELDLMEITPSKAIELLEEFKKLLE